MFDASTSPDLSHSSESLQPSLFQELWTLDDKQLKILKESIQKNNGTVQLLVHTHYEEQLNEHDPDDPNGLYLDQYKHDRDRLLDTYSNKSMPVITMVNSQPNLEEPTNDTLNDYKDWYGKHMGATSPGTIYYIRTYQSSSTPAFKNDSDFMPTPESRKKNWDILALKLRSLGINKIIIRGRNYKSGKKDLENLTRHTDQHFAHTHPENVDKQGQVDIPNKCVGLAIVELEARGFDLPPSRIRYPKAYMDRDLNKHVK